MLATVVDGNKILIITNQVAKHYLSDYHRNLFPSAVTLHKPWPPIFLYYFLAPTFYSQGILYSNYALAVIIT